MKPRFNRFIWFGFLIVVASVASYIPIFAVFAGTRDVPWVNYILILVGGALLAVGLQRAFRDQEHYRGKVSGSVLGSLSVLIAGVFVAFILYGGQQIPASTVTAKFMRFICIENATTAECRYTMGSDELKEKTEIAGTTTVAMRPRAHHAGRAEDSPAKVDTGS
jgi:hypothetical protein